MTRELYFEFSDSIQERNSHQASLFFSELLKLFCQKIHLESVYEKFIKPENRLLEFDATAKEFKYLDPKFLEYAHSLSIPHLVVCANFNHEGEEEFSEYLAQVLSAMEEMGLPDELIKELVSNAERNIES